MSTYDPEKAARVWQRVRAETAQPPDLQELLTMIAQELQSATVFLHLSRRMAGSPGAMLRHIAQQERSHAACLKGIYTMLSGSHPAVRPTPVTREESIDTVLRRCYGEQMRSIKTYEAKSTDPQFGQTFARLAGQEKEHCRLILELLGRENNRI